MSKNSKPSTSVPAQPDDADLLRQFDGMYANGDADVRNYSAKVVITRVPKKCPGNFSETALHEVPKGKRGVWEHALVEGKWRSCYTCEDCIMAWATERGIR